jgi:hypothetical protein
VIRGTHLGSLFDIVAVVLRFAQLLDCRSVMAAAEERGVDASAPALAGAAADNQSRALSHHDPEVKQDAIQFDAFLESVEAGTEIEPEAARHVWSQTDPGESLRLARQMAVIERVKGNSGLM